MILDHWYQVSKYMREYSMLMHVLAYIGMLHGYDLVCIQDEWCFK
jgi:hypothetical protein